MRHAVVASLVSLVIGAAVAGEPGSRTLTFEDRDRAQEAIERVYYSHQIGATKPFDEAVPKAVIQAKVSRYLKETSALEKIWNTPVTGEMLDRELRRMSSGSRMPDRLRELYAALGNDPVLIVECLARPTLTNRLARNFFDYDQTIHGRARAEAESIRARLASGQLRAEQAERRRTVVDLPRDRGPQAVDRASNGLPEAPGEVGVVVEQRDSYSVSVLLEHGGDHLRAAVYQIEKRTWEDWWGSVEADLSLVVQTPASQTAPGSARIVLPPVASCPADDTWEPTLDDAPEGRTDYLMVWTGSEMIVWGGHKPFFALNHPGLRYDPATDTWTLTSSVNAPTMYYSDQVAVWATGRMIVVGGLGGAYDPETDTWTPVSTVNAPSGVNRRNTVAVGRAVVVWTGSGAASGKRYDWATDTWTTLATLNEPSPRDGHTVASTGTGIIVWGGSPDTSGGVYDLATDSWSAMSTAGAPVARTAHTATWSGDEMLVWGGYDGEGNFRTDGGRYNPATDTWAPMSDSGAPTARYNHSAVWGDGKLLIWGGNDPVNPILGSGGRYDPSTDRWSSISLTNAPPPRREHVAVWTGERMIVWGGNRGADTGVNTGGRYDPVTDTWTPTSVGHTPDGRALHTAVWTGSSMIVWGGYNELAPGPVLGSGGRYDPATDDWSSTSNVGAPPGRYDHAAVWTGSSMIVWGGYAGYPTNYVNTGGRYDPITDTWSATSTTNAPAAGPGHTAAWTGNALFIWAGIGAGSGKYDPNLNTWSSISTSGAPPASGVAVWTGSVVVVWGRGSGGAGGGRYDPVTNTWAPVSAIGAPSVRDAATAVWTGHEMIVWGGLDGIFNAFDTGGRYDPVHDAWTPTSTVGAPERRYEHTAIWTGREMIVWGGLFRYPDFQNSGGRYDPATDTWTPTSNDNVPSGRHLHTAIWTGDAMVVYGGFGSEAGREEFSSGSRYAVQYDNDRDGFTVCQGDCNDADPSVHPGAPEVCNGIDDDCNGIVDDGGGSALCDDRNCCTIDSCAHAVGCIHTANPAAPVFTSQPSLSNAILWPPEHGYADFAVADSGAAAASSCGIASIQFASCNSSQPENATATGDGNSVRDCVYEPGAVHVRAERDGACTPIGRVYQITMVAVDVCGNTTQSTAFDVGVWHNRGNAPTEGTIVPAANGSETNDTRNGTNGTYSTDCGAGAPLVNGLTHDHSDADPEMEISQEAATSVEDLQLSKASEGNVILTWSDPTTLSAITVTRYHVWVLDPTTLFWTLMAELNKQTLSYQDPSLNDGNNWQYKITAVIE